MSDRLESIKYAIKHSHPVLADLKWAVAEIERLRTKTECDAVMLDAKDEEIERLTGLLISFCNRFGYDPSQFQIAAEAKEESDE